MLELDTDSAAKLKVGSLLHASFWRPAKAALSDVYVAWAMRGCQLYKISATDDDLRRETVTMRRSSSATEHASTSYHLEKYSTS